MGKELDEHDDDLVLDCIKQIESILDEIANKVKCARQDLATMDLAVAHIKEKAGALKDQREEMEEGLKLDSLDLYDVPLVIPKGASQYIIQCMS